jgi:hypothetical protein
LKLKKVKKTFARLQSKKRKYTEAGKAIGFALEQPLHVVALPCSALQILKRLQRKKIKFARKFSTTVKKNIKIETQIHYVSADLHKKRSSSIGLLRFFYYSQKSKNSRKS